MEDRIIQTDGKRQAERNVSFYNLEMMLAIRYLGCDHRTLSLFLKAS